MKYLSIEHKNLGKNIKHYRIKSNMSQETLAEKCNFSTRYVSDLENGKGNITFSKLISIAKKLKVEPYMLVKHQDINNSPKKVSKKKQNT